MLKSHVIQPSSELKEKEGWKEQGREGRNEKRKKKKKKNQKAIRLETLREEELV